MEIKALLIPNKTKRSKRKLSILKRKGIASFTGGHYMKEKEFFGLYNIYWIRIFYFVRL